MKKAERSFLKSLAVSSLSLIALTAVLSSSARAEAEYRDAVLKQEDFAVVYRRYIPDWSKCQLKTPAWATSNSSGSSRPDDPISVFYECVVPLGDLQRRVGENVLYWPPNLSDSGFFDKKVDIEGVKFSVSLNFFHNEFRASVFTYSHEGGVPRALEARAGELARKALAAAVKLDNVRVGSEYRGQFISVPKTGAVNPCTPASILKFPELKKACSAPVRPKQMIMPQQFQAPGAGSGAPSM